MANTNCLEGIRCPNCGYDEAFEIVVTGVAFVTDDGFDSITDGDWDDDSHITCKECGRTGLVKHFTFY